MPWGPARESAAGARASLRHPSAVARGLSSLSVRLRCDGPELALSNSLERRVAEPTVPAAAVRARAPTHKSPPRPLTLNSERALRPCCHAARKVLLLDFCPWDRSAAKFVAQVERHDDARKCSLLRLRPISLTDVRVQMAVPPARTHPADRGGRARARRWTEVPTTVRWYNVGIAVWESYIG